MASWLWLASLSHTARVVVFLVLLHRLLQSHITDTDTRTQPHTHTHRETAVAANVGNCCEGQAIGLLITVPTALLLCRLQHLLLLPQRH